MFKLGSGDTFFWPVEFATPADGGATELHSFDVQFKRLPQSRLLEIAQAVRAEKITDRAIACEVVVGWKGVEDENGEIPFTPATRERAFEVPGLEAAIVRAYLQAMSGAAKRKN